MIWWLSHNDESKLAIYSDNIPCGVTPSLNITQRKSLSLSPHLNKSMPIAFFNATSLIIRSNSCKSIQHSHLR